MLTLMDLGLRQLYVFLNLMDSGNYYFMQLGLKICIIPMIVEGALG